jgi:hypothetical protein
VESLDLCAVLLRKLLDLLFVLSSEFLNLNLMVLFELSVTFPELLFPVCSRPFKLLDLGSMALL